ncbi:MAG: tetratricopeptide repeat protein [Caldilineaceae bacterium]
MSNTLQREEITSFGEWVRRRRKALDLTQNDLARQMNYSLAAIRKIETDERRPSKQVAESLAEMLQIAPDQRDRFIKAARGELSTLRLPDVTVEIAVSEPVATPLPLSAPSPRMWTNAPIPATPLVGRTAELAQILHLFRQPECRLVTLVGPGGMGKTRLALAVAEQAVDEQMLNAAFVPLAAATSPETMLLSIADALALPLTGVVAPLNQIIEQLHEQPVLLVLDNLEHLLVTALAEPIAEIIVTLISNAPTVKLLVTSRERLDVQAEWVVELQGLALPAAHPSGDCEASSVTLFLQRTRQANVKQTFTQSDLAAVTRICQLVEGSPLGIELAAAWTPLLACTEIVQEIERSIHFLETSARGVPARHRSLNAVFEHSWQLLSAQEQKVLRQLSLFRSGFTREAAQAVAGASLHQLAALISKSLVRRNADNWYVLHELIRQFAALRLQAAGETAATEERFLAFALHLAHECDPLLRSEAQAQAVERLRQEHDNLTQALTLALAQNKAESAAQLCVALWTFWAIRSYFYEGLQWCERVLNAEQALPDAWHAQLLIGASSLAYRSSDLGRVRRFAEAAQVIQERIGDQMGLGQTLSNLAFVEQEAGNFAQARAYFEASLGFYRAVHYQRGVTITLNNLGNLLYDQGDLKAAQAIFTEALQRARQDQDADNIAIILTNLGSAGVLQQEPASTPLLGEALQIFVRLGNRIGVAFCLEGLAAVAGMNGQAERAAKLLGAAEALREEIHAPIHPAHRAHYARMIALGQGAAAAEQFRQWWSLGRGMGDAAAVAEAEIYVCTNDNEWRKEEQCDSKIE